MGTFLDCKVEPNFKKIEINEEIHCQKEEKDIKIKKNKKNKSDTPNNNIENLGEDDIIFNTDEEPSARKKKPKENLNTNNQENKKKINNTIYINNSNVTISNRNNNNINKKDEEDKLKETSNHEIKNDFNCFNSNEENIELDELLNKVFNNNIKTSLTNNNKNLLTESEIDKDYFDQLYSEQSQVNINVSNKNINENDEKIINKLKELKDKINNKNKPKKKKSKVNSEFNNSKPKIILRSMTNKQIRKNIPAYRRYSKQNISSILVNSFSYNKSFGKYKRFNNYSLGNNCFSLENSFNKSLCSSLLGKSVRDPFYNASHKNNNSNDSRVFRKKNSLIKRSRETPKRLSMQQQTYLNNSSLFNMSSSGIKVQHNKKSNKEKRLYKVISKNLKKNYNKSPKSKKNKSSVLTNKIIDINSEKENIQENNSNLFYDRYRDIVEVDLPIKFNNESLINNKLAESNINNKIILNYNKLNNFNTSIILYDGLLYKVIDKKNNNGFKISKRYFQITKNCFRYYNDIDEAKNDNSKSLVQFDIRNIKDLQIVDHDFLKDIKIDKKDIEFVFCIYLYQNDDFFVFSVNNENYGNSVFKILNLLKNFYEDKNKI